ncbi:MAG: undecaprenyldiphospho-muramoylpentapeptide beta-N-acetylglucosaminyltransferase [Kiritimatiellae bacterium]|nr:undecaprenyldiphospho-muramoylpentapeptide beta-N-acetylglucosaminyltransferase [Kiritimatiellia bacterium]
MSLHIQIACGGTGGHIFPGLATAEVLRERGHDVALWLAGKDIEAAAVEGWTGPVMSVAADGFPRRLLDWRSLRASWRLLLAVLRCRRRMRDSPPDVLLGMGSYACVAPIRAAVALGRPVVLHEANVIPGRAVMWLSRIATAVAASFEETRYHLRRLEITVTGLPLRRDIVRRALELQRQARPPAPFTVLVMGGSRGAHRLNEVMVAAVRRLGPAARTMRFLHLTGSADEAAVRTAYDRMGLDHQTRAFTLDMAAMYAAADLAICRAGATTCAELALFGTPALLVPYPYAARNHQLANARAFARHNGVHVVEERDLESGWLADYIAGMARAPERLDRMRAAMRRLARADAAERLADLVEAVAHHERGHPD